jgi:hypothetical protein
MLACFSYRALPQQSAPKPAQQTAPAHVPKYSRDWTDVVKKISSVTEKRVMEIAKDAGLIVSIEKNFDVTSIEFTDPVTHEPVLSVTQFVDKFPKSGKPQESTAAPK